MGSSSSVKPAHMSVHMIGTIAVYSRVQHRRLLIIFTLILQVNTAN